MRNLAKDEILANILPSDISFTMGNTVPSQGGLNSLLK
jgi:hypothetical protein